MFLFHMRVEQMDTSSVFRDLPLKTKSRESDTVDLLSYDINAMSSFITVKRLLCGAKQSAARRQTM